MVSELQKTSLTNFGAICSTSEGHQSKIVGIGFCDAFLSEMKHTNISLNLYVCPSIYDAFIIFIFLRD